MAKEVSSTLKKAYCPKCRRSDIVNHVFYVNPDAEVCYCPNCMAQLKPKLAINEYNLVIAQMINKAERLLYWDTDFSRAYSYFGNIIEVDDSITKARSGRILSLVYMSTLRHSHFIDAGLLLKSEAEQYFRKIKEYDRYAKFLHKIDTAVEEYYSRYVKRLTTVKDRFYSKDCVELYFMRLYEIITLDELVLEELNRIFNKEGDEVIGKHIDDLNKRLEKKKKLFEQRVITTDGYRYKVAKVVNDRKLIIAQLDERTTAITRYVKYRLYENEKKGKLIPDQVFPDNTYFAKMLRAFLPLFIVLYVLALGTIPPLFFIEDNLIKNILFIVGAALLFFALVTTILFIVWKVKLSKRRHLID